MGLFDWISATSTLGKLMFSTDRLVHQLTGVNPRHFHPALYRKLLDTVKEKQDEAEFSLEPPLTGEEGALIVLTLLHGGSVAADDLNSAHRPDVYKSAIAHLRLKAGDRIRGWVSLWAHQVSFEIDEIERGHSGEARFVDPHTMTSTKSTPSLLDVAAPASANVFERKAVELQREFLRGARPQPAAQESRSPPSVPRTMKTLSREEIEARREKHRRALAKWNGTSPDDSR